MSKGKYKAVRFSLAFKSKKGGEKQCRTKLNCWRKWLQVPALVPYDQLIKFINNIDMVGLKDIKDFCDDLDIDDDKLVSGRYRELADILFCLASMYIKLERENAVNLLWFGREDYCFSISLGADGAPFGKDEEAYAFLLSFLNLGQRVDSSAENFLLLGANCSETRPAMVKYAHKLVKMSLI